MDKCMYITDEQANLLTIRDPMVVVLGDTYYLTGTQPPYWEGVNDGVHLWSSKDLEHFTDHGLILKRADMPEDMWCRDGFWASELFDGGDGWFYLTFNCRNYKTGFEQSCGLARAREITGPYEIMTKDQPLLKGANDATLFRDDDGTLYLACNRSNPLRLELHRLDPSTGTVSDGELVCMTGTPDEWDHVGVEGQCICKHHGIYFQWYSSWTDTTYAAGYMTAPSIHGPWKKFPGNPVLAENDSYYVPGHNHTFRGLDGKDYITFHAQARNEQFLERFYIRPVEYRADGTVEIL